jgi:hypothetical protein
MKTIESLVILCPSLLPTRKKAIFNFQNLGDLSIGDSVVLNVALFQVSVLKIPSQKDIWSAGKNHQRSSSLPNMRTWILIPSTDTVKTSEKGGLVMSSSGRQRQVGLRDSLISQSSLTEFQANEKPYLRVTSLLVSHYCCDESTALEGLK